MNSTYTDAGCEPATHDLFGTDLVRVRDLLARGFAALEISQILGVTLNRSNHAIIVATDSREGSPSPEEIAAGIAEIQAGWTEEMAVAAWHGERKRRSSPVVHATDRWAATADRRRIMDARRRTTSGPVTVTHHRDWVTDRRYEARAHYHGRNATRCFSTQAEAEAWGRDWITAEQECDAEALHESVS
jgi:hypothetical protein